MAQNEMCRNCDYVYDAAIECRDGQRQKWTCPANFNIQSDNCLKRGEFNDKEDFDRMEIKITVGLTDEDRALVREILAAIMSTKKTDAQTEPQPEKQEPDVVIADPVEPETKPAAAAAAAVAKDVPEVDAFSEDPVDPKKIRDEAITLFRRNIKTHKTQIKALLAEYGADVIKDVPDESLPTFLGQLKELVAA